MFAKCQCFKQSLYVGVSIIKVHKLLVTNYFMKFRLIQYI